MKKPITRKELQAEIDRLSDAIDDKGGGMRWYFELQAAQAKLKAAEALAEALGLLHDETEEYIRINNLGDPHHNQSMKLSRAALKAWRGLK